MAEQLHHLLHIAQRPNVILRVYRECGCARRDGWFLHSYWSVRDFKPRLLENEPAACSWNCCRGEAYRRILAKLDEVALDKSIQWT